MRWQWTIEAANTVTRLMSVSRYPDPEIEAIAKQIDALPISWDLWSFSFLRSSGEVVIVDVDMGTNEITKRTGNADLLSTLVLGSRRYPELRGLLPEREPDAVNCDICSTHEIFAPGKVICPRCFGLGWISTQEDEG